MSDIRMQGNDDDLRAALEDVNLPTLLMVMTQLSGDDQWLAERYQPEPIVVPEGSLFPDDSGNFAQKSSLKYALQPLACCVIGAITVV